MGDSDEARSDSPTGNKSERSACSRGQADRGITDETYRTPIRRPRVIAIFWKSDSAGAVFADGRSRLSLAEHSHVPARTPTRREKRKNDSGPTRGVGPLSYIKQQLEAFADRYRLAISPRGGEVALTVS